MGGRSSRGWSPNGATAGPTKPCRAMCMHTTTGGRVSTWRRVETRPGPKDACRLGQVCPPRRRRGHDTSGLPPCARAVAATDGCNNSEDGRAIRTSEWLAKHERTKTADWRWTQAGEEPGTSAPAYSSTRNSSRRRAPLPARPRKDQVDHRILTPRRASIPVAARSATSSSRSHYARHHGPGLPARPSETAIATAAPRS